MGSNANRLSRSLPDVLGKFSDIQIKRETVIKLHDEAMAGIRSGNQRVSSQIQQADRLAAQQQHVIQNKQNDAQTSIGPIQKMFRRQGDRFFLQEQNSEKLTDRYRATGGGALIGMNLPVPKQIAMWNLNR